MGDARLAADGYREALLAAISAGPLARERTLAQVATPIAAGASGDPLLIGLGTLALRGYAAGAPMITRVIANPPAPGASLASLRLGCIASRAVADDAAWERRSSLLLKLARDTGVLSSVPGALTERLVFELQSGRLAEALALGDQLGAVVASSPARGSLDPRPWIAAHRGRADEALALLDGRRADVLRRGHGQWLTIAEGAAALALNGAGAYEDALAHALRADVHPYDLGIAYWVLPELVEAAVRAGDPERAHAPAARLAEIAAAAGTDWAHGLAARAAALLDPTDAAEAHHAEAIARLGRTRIRTALARAHLLYGEWLRRRHRRVDARTQLRLAHAMLAEMGADGFAERARRELIATGETVRRRSADTLDDLTPQEAEVARLAAGGHTNREIGAQLFLSPRTVEWHLSKVFGKLGVSSRRALTGVLVEGAR
jgi:DNA-binding CsgD family transcriptional regulator